MSTLDVLVVEDDAMIGLLLGEMLEDMGYNVCAVSATEDDAVADAARCKPDFMLVDMELRQGSGQGAMKRILESGPMPHVYMSGAPARASGPVLQKPFPERDLVRAIRAVTGA